MKQWSQTSGVVFMGCKFIRLSSTGLIGDLSVRPLLFACLSLHRVNRHKTPFDFDAVFAPHSLCLVLFLECLEYFNLIDGTRDRSFVGKQ